MNGNCLQNIIGKLRSTYWIVSPPLLCGITKRRFPFRFNVYKSKKSCIKLKNGYIDRQNSWRSLTENRGRVFHRRPHFASAFPTCYWNCNFAILCQPETAENWETLENSCKTSIIRYWQIIVGQSNYDVARLLRCFRAAKIVLRPRELSKKTAEKNRSIVEIAWYFLQNTNC